MITLKSIKISKKLSKIGLILSALVVLFACNITKHVPEGKFLLKENKKDIIGDKAQVDQVNEDEIEEIFKQQPNIKTFGFWRLRLRVYNMVDSTKAQEKHIKRLNRKVFKHNGKILKKEKKINDKRIKKAIKEAEKDKAPAAIAKREKHNSKVIKKQEVKFIRKWRKDSIPETGTTHQIDSIHKLNLRRYSILTQNKNFKLERKIKYAKTTYVKKSLDYKLEDTLNIGLSGKERRKYKFGEAPVIIDSAKVSGTVRELTKYMISKGFVNAKVTGNVIPNVKKKTGKIYYNIETGNRKYFDTIKIDIQTAGAAGQYRRYLEKVDDKAGINQFLYKGIYKNEVVHFPFDADLLNEHRYLASKYLRDKSVYDFTENNIVYEVDSTHRKKGDDGLTLKVVLLKRQVFKEGQTEPVYINHVDAKVIEVNFIIADSSMYVGSFREDMREKLNSPDKVQFEKDFKPNNFLITQDTMSFDWLLDRVQIPDTKPVEFYKSQKYSTIFGFKDSINYDLYRQATFYYNGDLFVRPELIESQNYLEQTNYYKDYYLDRSYTRLSQLNLFSVIKPVMKETYPGSGELKVTYYLVPSVRQGFSFEPKATNASGFLGLSASVSYYNKNIFKSNSRITRFDENGDPQVTKRKFRSGTSFNFSISGGLESNLEVFDNTTTSTATSTARETIFNTKEIGPSVKLEIPGLFPIRYTFIKNKRMRPKTLISAGYNYQDRPEFKRKIVQVNYSYKTSLGTGKTQNLTIGLPGMSTLKFVNFDGQGDFDQKINATGNLFLRNQYSDQFIWEDIKVNFEYDNLEKEDDKRFINIRNYRTISSITGILAGNMASVFGNIKNEVDSATNHPMLLGIPYSRFLSLDFKWISTMTVFKKSTFAYKILASTGFSSIKNSASMPYDYSFFAGGSNDNRGWVARSLGPGSYNSLLDSNSIQTQIADYRLASSVELRFGNGFFNHAFFADAGNIWTRNVDDARPGSRFSGATFWKEIGLTVGYGLRIDLSFFIVRLDIGWPIYIPAYPTAERWFFQEKINLEQQMNDYWGAEATNRMPNFWHQPRLQFGIGLPF
ncbi:MAG: BamA/TamA family outer membrane protein [Fluviicola sp.]